MMPIHSSPIGDTTEKVNLVALALTLGLVWAAVMAIAALTAPLGWNAAWVTLWADTYVGYGPGVVGALVGFAWGFADAAIGTLLVGWLYRIVASAMERATARRHAVPRV